MLAVWSADSERMCHSQGWPCKALHLVPRVGNYLGRGIDGKFLSVCYEYFLLPLVIKEAVLVNGLVKSEGI